jgi:hypothetical protein
MQMPPKSHTIEEAKANIAERLDAAQRSIENYIDDVANTGFADKRLCAIAKTDIEKAFLILAKALRMGSPNDYAKQPFPDDASELAPPPAAGDFSEGEAPRRHIEWQG